jgi:cytochrome c
VVEIAFADVYAAADAGAGERLWRQCQACHALNPGQNGVGPHLNGVVGRRSIRRKGSTIPTRCLGWKATGRRRTCRGSWRTRAGYAPGTAMSYNGMSDVEDRANLIAYLATQE